jgi:N6-adenosine-specific RNA methylase IME4
MSGERYSLVYCDPPWTYRNKRTGGSMKSGSADKYDLLTTDEICKLDVPSIVTADAALFLWATVPLLDEAFEVINAWGFKYKTSLFWVKEGRLGLGYWFRGGVEVLLLGIKGKVPAFRFPIVNYLIEKPREHSRKPDFYYSLLERTHLTPRVELFARHRRPGWDCFGNEVDSDIDLAMR